MSDTEPSTFFDDHDTIDPEILPPPPITADVVVSKADDPTRRTYDHVMSFGTTLSDEWDEPWIRLVVDAELAMGRAICGSKRKAEDLVEQGITPEELTEEPLRLVCKAAAGLGTDHPGEGRCVSHGGMLHLGTLKTGHLSLLRHNKLSPRVHEFFENEQMLDLRVAIGLIYAALDEQLGEGSEIDADAAQQIGNLMTKVGQLVKTHNEIMSAKKIAIEVPEFMAWAEFFYELAIGYIESGKGDVHGFLTDAEQFFNATVTLTIGDEQTQATARRDSAAALGNGSDQ